MKGKVKCKALKEIRRQIAEQNDIEYVVSECTYQGDCSGTCPKCEAELRYLERELEARKAIGKAVAIIGISTAVAMSTTACHPLEAFFDDPLAGDVQMVPDDDYDTERDPGAIVGFVEPKDEE